MLHGSLFDDMSSSRVFASKRRVEPFEDGILVSQDQSFGCRERQLCDREIVLQQFLQIFRIPRCGPDATCERQSPCRLFFPL